MDVTELKQKHPHLEPVTLSQHNVANVKKLLGQDGFHFVHPLELFESDHQITPVVVHLPLGWVLSGPLPSTSALVSICFEAFVRTDNESELAEQLRKRYELDSHRLYKQIKTRTATNARALRILEHSTYKDVSSYHIGMVWAGDDSGLPEN